MRAVDVALLADALAARVAWLSAELERKRGALRAAALAREARRALDEATVVHLERLAVLERTDARALRRDVFELCADLDALRELQAWTEEQLAALSEGAWDRGCPASGNGREPRAFGAQRADGVGQRGASATRSPPSSS